MGRFFFFISFFLSFFWGGALWWWPWRSLSEGSGEMIVRIFRWISGLYL
jgi:hypothetical protein